MASLCPACAVARFMRELREAGGLRNGLFRQATCAIERAVASAEKAARTASEHGPVVVEGALTCANRVSLRSSASVDFVNVQHGSAADGAAVSNDTPLFSLRIQIAHRPGATGAANE